MNISRLSYNDYLQGTQELIDKNAQDKQMYEIEILNRKFLVYPDVFSPKYFLDTAFFAENLPIVKWEDFLEIWPWTWVTVIFALRRWVKRVTAIDINENAVKNTIENLKKYWLEEYATVLHWNVYEPLWEWHMFDTIYWNTPFWYIKQEEQISLLEKAVYDPWYVSTKKFISEAKKYLKPNGRLLIWFSSTLGRFDLIQETLNQNWFSVELFASIESLETHPVNFEIFVARYT